VHLFAALFKLLAFHNNFLLKKLSFKFSVKTVVLCENVFYFTKSVLELISEGSCDTEDLSNDDEKSALPSME